MKNIKEIKEKLERIGFVPIYENHPCLEVRQFDFIKNGVRIQCFLSEGCQTYYKCNYEVLSEKFIYSVVGTFIFDFDTVLKAHVYFASKRKPSLLSKIKKFLQ